MLTAAAGFCALVVAVLLAGLLVRDVLGDGRAADWEVEVSRWLARHRDPTLNTVSSIGSEVAGVWEVPAGMTIAIGTLFLLRQWCWATFLLVAIVLEGLVYTTVTYVFSRERPGVPQLEHLIRSDSFPSGHTAASIVMYGGIALVVTAATTNRVARVAAWSAAVIVPLWVAGSRIYRGMHYVTDTVVGACIGLACLLIALFAVEVACRVSDLRDADGERLGA